MNFGATVRLPRGGSVTFPDLLLEPTGKRRRRRSSSRGKIPPVGPTCLSLFSRSGRLRFFPHRCLAVVAPPDQDVVRDERNFRRHLIPFQRKLYSIRILINHRHIEALLLDTQMASYLV